VDKELNQRRSNEAHLRADLGHELRLHGALQGFVNFRGAHEEFVSELLITGSSTSHSELQKHQDILRFEGQGDLH
jgi:hypothetical protein